MAIVGLRNANINAGAGTSNPLSMAGQFAPPDIRPRNWRETMLLLYPNSSEIGKAPLTALTSMMKSESTDDPEFNWFSKQLDDRRVVLTTDIATTGQTALVVSNVGARANTGAFIVKTGDVLMVEGTGELVRVTADPTTGTGLTVSRGFGGTTAAVQTFAGNPNLIVVGSAYEEGSNSPSGVNYDPVQFYNYCQIFRNSLELTRTASKTRLRTGDAVKEAKRECLEIMSVDMERAFWFGGRALVTLNGKPCRSTAGIVNQIKAGNTLAGSCDGVAFVSGSGGCAAPAAGKITLKWVDDFMEACFRYGSHEKMAFSGNTPLMAIQQAVRLNTSYQIEYGVKEYGMLVSKLHSPFGTLVMKTHPLFTQMTAGSAGNLSAGNNIYVLDMDKIKYRYVDDVKYESDLTAVGLDGMKSGYLAECGLELQHPNAHFMGTGIISGAKDT
jgi:hypothetical protein